MDHWIFFEYSSPIILIKWLDEVVWSFNCLFYHPYQSQRKIRIKSWARSLAQRLVEVLNKFYLHCTAEYINELTLIAMLFKPGWGACFLWCSWTRRKPPRRRTPGDDRTECDRVHWWVTHGDIWWSGLTLPHTLRPKAQCLTVPGDGIHHCWAP